MPGHYLNQYGLIVNVCIIWPRWVNTLSPRRNRRHFADDICKCIFLNENVLISNKISLKLVPKGPINNILALVQIMAWRRPGDKPLSEPMMIISLTHICVTRPQWVKLYQDLVVARAIAVIEECCFSQAYGATGGSEWQIVYFNVLCCAVFCFSDWRCHGPYGFLIKPAYCLGSHVGVWSCRQNRPWNVTNVLIFSTRRMKLSINWNRLNWYLNI